MAVYINGIGAISPQETRTNAEFLPDVIEYTDAYLPIAEPPYKEYINPRELRRMSKIIRNGITAARIALDDSKLEMPDAILTGTGLGCAIDTEKFLLSLIDNNESLLTPTSFIQSTHNTIGGGIAIGLGCHNYNMTYVHRGFSFETALHDGLMMLNDGEAENILVGGFDEMTDNHIILLKSTGIYQADGFSNLKLKEATNGTIAGQGASFFVLEKQKTDRSYAQLNDIQMMYNVSQDELLSNIQRFLEKNNLQTADIDFVLMGYNGLEAETKMYNAVANTLFPQTGIGYFKHLCGEYYTASAFATWLSAQILQKQHIPGTVLFNQTKPEKVSNLLVYNQFQGNEHSLLLFSKC